MNLEIWHVQLTMDKSIMSAYYTPLKPFLVALGYVSESHVQYLLKYGNLHHTRYIFKLVSRANQITLCEQFYIQYLDSDTDFPPFKKG